MDPELYVFPKLESPPVKVAASTALFLAVTLAARRLLPGSGWWSASPDEVVSISTATLGYCIFIYASYQAWLATREKNTAEDPRRGTAVRLLESGLYAQARHPMYGMFILANAGLGLALNSLYGLVFSLLSLAAFWLNSIIEERAGLMPQFGEKYRAYMRRVRARCFSLPQALLLAAALILNAAGVFLR